MKYCLICGKSENFNIAFAKKFKGVIISANAAAAMFGLIPDVILIQDSITNVKRDSGGRISACSLLVLKSTIENEFNFLKLKNKVEYFKRSKDIDFKDGSLCVYPYTGIGCLHWAIKKGFKRIYVTGFEFGNNHNWARGERYVRDWYTLKMYRERFGALVKYAHQKGVSVKVV